MSRLFSITKGDTVPCHFTVKDYTGTAVDLTGATTIFTVKKKSGDSNTKALFQKTWSVHTTPVSGITDITLTSDDTNRQPGSYFWQLQVTGSSGAISTCDMGEFIIKPHLNESA